MNVLKSFRLDDRVVLLTGGAGLYGRQITSAIAQAGARLVIASRDKIKLETVAGELNRCGLDVLCESYDQNDEQSILAMKDRILHDHGRIDGLVNNSVTRTMKGKDDDVSAWEQSMRVNATGLFLMMRTFGDVMARQQSGSIVNIGSIQGVVGVEPGLYEGTNMGVPAPDYFFHKAGMINMGQYFASIYGKAGVRVNTISAGGFFNNQPEPFLSRYNAKTMLGRMAGDSDLGGPVVYLLSDASTYVTGVNLVVDGGYTAK